MRSLPCLAKFSASLLLVALVCLTGPLCAQQSFQKTKFQKIDAALSSSRVTCILQDKAGFLWVATEDGLNRFDGYEFKVYRNHKNDTASLLKNSVLRLFEDTQGKLWVSMTNGGLQIYDRTHDNFHRIPEYLFDCEIRAITDDEKYHWIAGIKYGVAFIDQVEKSSGKKTEFVFSHGSPIQKLIRRSRDSFWVGVRGEGVFKWIIGQPVLERVEGTGTNRIVSNAFHDAAEDAEGNLWITTSGGVSKMETASGKFINYTKNSGHLPVDNVLHVCVDNDKVWFGTENGGLCRLDTKTNLFSFFRHDRCDPTSFADNSVWAISKDREGRVWFGTYSNGICVLDPLSEKFGKADFPLENDIVNVLFQDSKKRYWIGTEAGVMVFGDGKARTYTSHSRPGALSSDPILAIEEDNDHQIWLGAWDGGLNRYDERNDRFIPYQPEEKREHSLSNPHVFAIKQLKESNQFVAGTYHGLNILRNQNRGDFEQVFSKEFLFNNFIRTIYEDRKGNVWVGTIEELLRYDPFEKNLTRFETATHPDSISVTGLSNCILEDKTGNLWVGTNNGLHLIRDSRFVRRFTVSDGLPNDIVSGILEDDRGFLWLSTGSGISRFNPSSQTFRNYDVHDGVIVKGFKPGACLRDDKGQFFFGGKGINLFYPDSIKDNPNVPRVYITELKINNRSVHPGDADRTLDKQISEATEVTLAPDQNFVVLKYVALNFTASNKNRYAYKLEGFDRDWNYVGGERSVSFTNLDAGTYTFRVKACNNDGLWNEEGASLVITVLPPWWETLSFRALTATLLAGMIVALFKLRVRAIENKNKRLEKLVVKRTAELAEQNHVLRESREEISAQRDQLTEKNVELMAAREIIEKQNEEILKRNQSLEIEVADRTRGLVEYNQQLEQFAFISAHNLRAPVARILGLGNLFKLTRESPQESDMILGKLMSATHELDFVVKDLTTILDVRKGTTQSIQPVDIHEVVTRIKGNLETEISETGTVFIEEFSEGSRINSIKAYIDSILYNLIGNAIKYRHPHRDPVVRITTSQAPGRFFIRVQDNGIGIDLDSYRDKMFTLYRRFHHHVEGKGMGLYLVKTQVVMLGGQIEVESRPDYGTTFTITLKNERIAEQETSRERIPGSDSFPA